MKESGRLSRKLAVILHADVVDSTELVRRNETVAHERIQDAFHRLSATVEAYGGLPHEIRGDALVAEFNRASDAVCAALAFQARNTQFNTTIYDDIQPQLRIGVALGEVIIDDHTITGEGVVLAQRLEQLASVGSVCIQGSVYEAVPARLPFEYENLGEQEVKGFVEPVRAYAVIPKFGENIPAPEHSSAAAPSPIKETRWQWLAGSAICLAIIIGGVVAWLAPWQSTVEPASIERMAFPMPDKLSIAVLPFANMSGDPEQEYFVDGITEDLITDISKISELFVIARNSVFTYKGTAVKIAQVAEELGVRYVLEGSVRKVGDQIRINAQLIDATTGGHLWAERYDGVLEDVFALQDQVTQQIIVALAVELTADEKAHGEKQETRSPEAYDAFLKGWEHYQRRIPEQLVKAAGLFERAVELDPQYSRAYGVLAALYWEVAYKRWEPAFKLSLSSVRARAEQYLERAMMNPTPLALVVASDRLMRFGKTEQAIERARRAVGLAPNYPDALIRLAEILVWTGRPQEALTPIVLAERLDPFNRAYQLYIRGLAEFGLEDFEGAIVSLARALELESENRLPAASLAAAYAYLGRDKDALAALKVLNTVSDSQSLGMTGDVWGIAEIMLQIFSYRQERDRERMAEGLRKAGMPERSSDA